MYASTAHRFIAIVLVVTYLQPFITCGKLSSEGLYISLQNIPLYLLVDSIANYTYVATRRPGRAACIY